MHAVLFKLGVAHRLFGEVKDDRIEDWLQKVNGFFSALQTIIVDNIAIGCTIETPKVIILGAGDSPSNNESIFETCRAYFKDLNIEKRRLDIWADQVIHQ